MNKGKTCLRFFLLLFSFCIVQCSNTPLWHHWYCEVPTTPFGRSIYAVSHSLRTLRSITEQNVEEEDLWSQVIDHLVLAQMHLAKVQQDVLSGDISFVRKMLCAMTVEIDRAKDTTLVGYHEIECAQSMIEEVSALLNTLQGVEQVL